MSSSLMFRYWSTDFRVPRMEMSFFSSTVRGVLVRVLKKEKKSMVSVGGGCGWGHTGVYGVVVGWGDLNDGR